MIVEDPPRFGNGLGQPASAVFGTFRGELGGGPVLAWSLSPRPS
jgi:hypothetical protein